MKLTPQKITQIVELLRFILTIDDPEITHATIESVIETLEEEINCSMRIDDNKQ